jgi:hypothetical protein
MLLQDEVIPWKDAEGYFWAKIYSLENVNCLPNDSRKMRRIYKHE